MRFNPSAGSILHARCLAAGDHHAQCAGAGNHLQIGPAAGRVEVGIGGTPAPVAEHGAVSFADAVLPAVIEVVIPGQSHLEGGGHEGFREWVVNAAAERLQGPLGTVPLAGLRHVALGADEVGEAVGEAPAGVSELGPLVVVGLIAAEIHHAIDGARAADHLAAWQEEHAVPKVSLGRAAVAPIQSPRLHQRQEARRHSDEGVAVPLAGFKQHDLRRGVCRQPVGKDASG